MNTKTIKLACIIDDDVIYICLVRKIIESKNLCSGIIVFNDGEQSINYFESLLKQLDNNEVPDIIFLDLNMPIMDGWEFLERFKLIKHKLPKEISLYVVSSSINPMDVNRAKATPTVNDYLVKPVKLKDLETIFLRKTS